MEKMKGLYTNWCRIDDKIRFLFVGGVNAAFAYLLFIIFILIFGESQRQLCVALQWIFSSVFSYFNQKFFVFCTKGNYLKEYIKCCSTWAFGYFLNVILLELLIRFVLPNVCIAQFVSMFLVSVFTYIIFKCFAFKS